MTEKDRKEFVKLINEEFTRLEYEKRMKNNALTFEDIEDTISLLPKLKTMLKNNELQLEAVKLGINQSSSSGIWKGYRLQ